MKPLHIGLLIVGAALAGGLAMRMTELQPVPVAPLSAVRAVPVLKTTPVNEPAVQPVPPKPSPMPDRIAPAAPAPVYVEPVHIEQVHIEQVAPKSKPVLTAPAARAPVMIAKVAPPPPMLPPVPYDPPSPPPEPEAAPPPPPPAPRRTATLPAGMAVAVRLNESLSSERGIAGDTFSAALSEPLVVDGLVIAERGARARGRIVGTQRAGRVSGTYSLDLELTAIETADGQNVEISTAPWTKRGDTATPSRGKPVNVPSETVIRFRLASRVTVTERQL